MTTVVDRSPERAAHAGLKIEEDLLQLPGGGDPKRVFVTEIEVGKDERVAGFGLEEGGPFYIGGMEWPTAPPYSLFIDFVLLDGVRAIRVTEESASTIFVSDPLDSTQRCAVTMVPSEYPFFVELSTGKLHDPRMVVTPLLLARSTSEIPRAE